MECKLYQEDCIEGLARQEAGTVDLAFADPPFNIGYEYDVYNDLRDSDRYLSWTRNWGRAVHRVLKPSGTFWLAIGDDYAAELKLIFQKELGFSCRSWVIWYYTFGVNCTKKFSRSHTHLFHFVKDPNNFTFDSLAIRVPSARQLVYADSRADSRGRLPDDTWILRPQDLPDGFQPDEDTWYFSRVCGTFKERAGWHGCQMPEQLLGRIIRACSKPDDLVLDPFAGSGTTLVAAKKLGRRWIGFELSANYASRTQARLDAAEPGQPLEGAEDPKASAPPTVAGKRLGGRLSSVPLRTEASDIRRGIIEAFFTARDGFSADRVITDPELNGQFLETCKRLGLPGQPGMWNWQLMNLRKAGQFTGLPRSRRSTLTREEFDRYSFACEIAMEQLKQKGQSLDRVLCEPAKAAEFDCNVQSMISDQSIVAEKVAPFKIRWIAFHLRKRASSFQEAGRRLKTLQQLPRLHESLPALDWEAVPESSGLYWLKGPNRDLYVGKALDLRQRFQLQLTTSKFDFWGTSKEDLEVRYCELADVDDAVLKGNQARWIAKLNPVGNFSGFAAAV